MNIWNLPMAQHRWNKFSMILIGSIFWNPIEVYFNLSHLVQSRIAIIAPFSHLHHFPGGVCFKQWTGDDSNALMKVKKTSVLEFHDYVLLKSLLSGLSSFNWGLHPPGDGTCYLHVSRVRQSSMTEYPQYRNAQGHGNSTWAISSIPRMFCWGWCPPPTIYASSATFIMHYTKSICLFGSPNGLCTSITESKHIKAIKEPWHWSNHYNALGQMLVTNQCLDKLVAARIDFTRHGMLKGTYLSSVLADLHKCFIFLVIFLGAQNTFPSR